MYLARVYVTMKQNVLDPQGQAVREALHALGFTQATGVRVGKYLQLDIDANDPAEAEALAREMCERLLANPVIEEYRLEVRDGEGEAATS